MSTLSTRLPTFFFLVGGLCLAPAVAFDSQTSETPIDVIGYVLDIDLRPDALSFAGIAEISFVTSRPLERVEFDLVGLTVDSVKVDGSPATYERDDGKLIIELGRRVAADASLSATVYYGGAPVDGLLFGASAYRKPTVFADNWPDRARQWFPSIDHPSDKATVELRVRAPGPWQVVGVGSLLSEEVLAGGRKLTVWATDRPLPTYSMVFGAAEMVVGNLGALGCERPGGRCIPITSWMYPEDARRGPQLFAPALRVAEFYDSLIGPFPYEKLALVQSKTRYGGMENASAIFLYEQVGQADNVESLIAHEVAHQWFGDSVTEGEWSHLWLSEGFATYFTAVYYEFTQRPAEANAMLQRNKQGYMASPRAVGSSVVGEVPEDLRSLLNANNYQKGALVLHMLRGVVGEEAFFAGIRRFYAKHAHSNALTEDFQRIMEDESGEDLAWFFEQWLYRPGYPQVEARVRPDTSSDGLEFVLRQVQPGPPYRFPLTYEFRFTGQDFKARNTVWIEERERRARVILPTLPDRLILDPEGVLLAALAVVQ
jgi:aminopeptidase N